MLRSAARRTVAVAAVSSVLVTASVASAVTAGDPAPGAHVLQRNPAPVAHVVYRDHCPLNNPAAEVAGSRQAR
jgi:hypothetical protein